MRRALLTIAVLALAVGLVLPLGYLPQTDAVVVLGGVWGWVLGIGVLSAWAAIWSR